MSATSWAHCVGDEKPKQNPHRDQEACNIWEEALFSVGEHLVVSKLWSLALKGEDGVKAKAAATEGEQYSLCGLTLEIKTCMIHTQDSNDFSLVGPVGC